MSKMSKMSKISKNNNNNSNRFNLLLDTNTNTNNTSKNTISNLKKLNPDNEYKTNRFVSKVVNEERNKKQKEETFIKSLSSLSEFPELQIKKKDAKHAKDENLSKKLNFIDIVNLKNTNGETFNEDKDEGDKIVPPGCVCISYDKKTKQEVWVYGENMKTTNEQITREEKPYQVFQRLIELYKNRKYEYINNWGIEEYDKMFMFQNYDYDYFDKLDEETDKCIKKYYQNIHTMNNNHEPLY